MIQDKQKDESYVAFAKRVTDAYENRLINIDEWGEIILGENIYSSETTRWCNMFMRRFLELCEVDEALRKQDKTPEELDLMALKENIQEERLKLQIVNPVLCSLWLKMMEKRLGKRLMYLTDK